MAYGRLIQDQDNADQDAVEPEESRSRRLSLQVQDLPVTAYFSRWDCCRWCLSLCKKDGYEPFLNEEEASLKTGRSASSRSKSPLTSKSRIDEKAKETLISEQCLDATVDKIVSNLSWVNATLLACAMINSLHIEFNDVGADYGKANNAWIYFFVIFTAGILLAVLPRAFEDLDEMKRELELKTEQKKIAEGDEEALQKLEEKKKAKEEEKSLLEVGAKVYKFVEVEANDLVEKFEDLFVATLSNTVSMAWRDAAKATFALIVGGSTSATATAYFFYAIFMTCCGIYLVIRIGGVYEKKQKLIMRFLDGADYTAREEKKELLKFAFVQRSIYLTQTVVKFAIAWSWRDCINAFIKAVYGGNSNDPVAEASAGVEEMCVDFHWTLLLTHSQYHWGYFFSIALFVSIAFSFSEQFHILYPKSGTETDLKAWLTDTSRLQVNDVIYDNLRFVVGMGLFDALMISLQSLAGTDMSNGVQCLLYWLVAISGISLSIIGTHYAERWGLRRKIADKGMAQALFDTFERFYDPECELHIEGDSDFVPMILDTSMYEFVYVCVFGLGIAGSMGTTNAIKFTINSITSSSGYYDVNDPNSAKVHGNWVIWVSFLICLAISTLITGYFARMINVAKIARRELFERFRKVEENKEAVLDELREDIKKRIQDMELLAKRKRDTHE